MKFNNTELAIYTASGQSSHECEAYTELLKTSRIDNMLLRMCSLKEAINVVLCME
jgi:hypothetical protein